jgi:transcriptional repressor of cell division inhibition gene dicB
MKTEAAIGHFGSTAKLADVLGITVQAIYQWGDSVPRLRALELEKLTDGRLSADSKSKRRVA